MNTEPKLANPNRTSARMTIMLVICGFYFLSYFYRISVPGTIFNELQIDFKTSAANIALLGAITIYIYSALQLLVGPLTDRFGAGRMLLVGGGLMTAGGIFFPLAKTLSLLFAARALTGLGASFIFLSMVKEIDELFAAKHFAIVLGACVFLGYGGGLTGTWPLERAVSRFGWRNSFFAAAIVSILITLVASWLFGRKGMLKFTGKTFSLGRIRDIVFNWTAVPVIISGSVCFALYFTFQATIGKKLLQDCFGFSSSSAAGFSFAMALVNTIGVVSIGFICSAFGNRRKPMIYAVNCLLLLSQVCLAGVLTGFLPRTMILPCYVMIALAGCGTPIYCASVKELNPPDSAATSVGFINFIAYLLIASFGNAAGVVLDYFGGKKDLVSGAIIYPRQAYITVTAGCIAIALISITTSFFVRETRGRSIYEELTKQPASEANANNTPSFN